MHRFSKTATELRKQKPKCLNDDNEVKDDGLDDGKASEDESAMAKPSRIQDMDDLGDDNAEYVIEDDDNLSDYDNVVKDDGLGDGKASEDEGLGEDEAIEDTDDDAEDVTEDDDNLGDDDSVVKDGRLGDSKASGDEGLGKDKAIEDTDDLVNDIVEDVTEDGDNLGNANVSIIFLPQIFNHCIDVQSPQ